MEIEWTEVPEPDGKDVEHHAQWNVGPFCVLAYVYEGVSGKFRGGYKIDERDPDGNADPFRLGGCWVEAETPNRKTLKGAKNAAVKGAQGALAPYAAMMLEYAASKLPRMAWENLLECAEDGRAIHRDDIPVVREFIEAARRVEAQDD